MALFPFQPVSGLCGGPSSGLMDGSAPVAMLSPTVRKYCLAYVVEILAFIVRHDGPTLAFIVSASSGSLHSVVAPPDPGRSQLPVPIVHGLNDVKNSIIPCGLCSRNKNRRQITSGDLKSLTLGYMPSVSRIPSTLSSTGPLGSICLN